MREEQPRHLPPYSANRLDVKLGEVYGLFCISIETNCYVSVVGGQGKVRLKLMDRHVQGICYVSGFSRNNHTSIVAYFHK